MVVVIVAIKVLVWDVEVINVAVTVKVLIIEVRAVMVNGKLSDVDMVVEPFTFLIVVSVSYSVDVLARWWDTSTNRLAGVIMVFVSGIGVEVLANVNANIFAAVMTVLEFDVPSPLVKFVCCAAFNT